MLIKLPLVSVLGQSVKSFPIGKTPISALKQFQATIQWIAQNTQGACIISMTLIKIELGRLTAVATATTFCNVAIRSIRHSILFKKSLAASVVQFIGGSSVGHLLRQQRHSPFHHYTDY